MRVGGSTSEFEAKGMKILDCTWPVAEEAALRRPSVPAEYRTLSRVSIPQVCVWTGIRTFAITTVS